MTIIFGFASRRLRASTRYDPATLRYSASSVNRSFWIRVT